MSEKGILARALANRHRGTLETQMPPAPAQGPAPNFAQPPLSTLPPFQAHGAIADKYMPFVMPQQTMPPITVQAERPTPMMAKAAQPPNDPGFIMPPPEQFGPAEPYGPQAPAMPRNELERDYMRQLAENPNGFDKGWLGRIFG